MYAALYRNRDGAVNRVSDYYVGEIPGLAALVTEPAVLVGPEAMSYAQLIGQAVGTTGVSLEVIEGLAKGSAVASLAASRLERGEIDETLALAPLYLKESTAKAFLGRYSGKA